MPCAPWLTAADAERDELSATRSTEPKVVRLAREDYSLFAEVATNPVLFPAAAKSGGPIADATREGFFTVHVSDLRFR